MSARRWSSPASISARTQEAFGQNLLAMTLMAIPEAEQQFIEFLQSMCTPPGLHEAQRRRRLTKQQAEDNQAAITEMVEELNNPELGDLMDLAEAIVRQEAPEIQALGKRVASLLELAKKTGPAGGQERREKESSSPEPSPEPSISSATSTDGPTSTSSASRSAASGSASPRRRAAASASS